MSLARGCAQRTTLQVFASVVTASCCGRKGGYEARGRMCKQDPMWLKFGITGLAVGDLETSSCQHSFWKEKHVHQRIIIKHQRDSLKG